MAACAALLLGVCATGAPVAHGAGNAFSELTESAQTTTTATAKTSSEGSSDSNSTGVIVIALVAAVLLLSGIAFVIVRDARRVAPAGENGLGGRGSRDPAARARQRRAKAKAARQQRKRNR